MRLRLRDLSDARSTLQSCPIILSTSFIFPLWAFLWARSKNLASQKQRAMQVGEYTLLKVIGEGSFGVVWKASHEKHGVVAVKVLPSKNIKARKELCILASIQHSSIVRVYDVFEAVIP